MKKINIDNLTTVPNTCYNTNLILLKQYRINKINSLSFQYFKIEKKIKELQSQLLTIKNKIIDELKANHKLFYKNKYVTIKENPGSIHNSLKPDIKVKLLQEKPDYFNTKNINKYFTIRINI